MYKLDRLKITGNDIKNYARYKGITLKELAKRFNMTQGALYQVIYRLNHKRGEDIVISPLNKIYKAMKRDKFIIGGNDERIK